MAEATPTGYLCYPNAAHQHFKIAAYEALHPNTKHGANQHTDRSCQVGVPSFSEDQAAKTGQSERAIQRDAERGAKVCQAALDGKCIRRQPSLMQHVAAEWFGLPAPGDTAHGHKTMLNKTNFCVGDLVKLREGSAIAASRRAKLHIHGLVVASKNIDGYGEGVMVQWPGEEAPWVFQPAGLF